MNEEEKKESAITETAGAGMQTLPETAPAIAETPKNGFIAKFKAWWSRFSERHPKGSKLIWQFIKFFVFSPTNTASTAETIRKILLTCATKMRSIFAAPIYIFSKTEKYANSGIRPSTSCILRMPFPGQRRIVKSEITSMTAYP